MLKVKTPSKIPMLYAESLRICMNQNIDGVIDHSTWVILPRSLVDDKSPKLGQLELAMLNQGPVQTSEARITAIGSFLARLVKDTKLEINAEDSQLAFDTRDAPYDELIGDVHSYIALRSRLYRVEGWLSVVNYYLKADKNGVAEVDRGLADVPRIMPALIWGRVAQPGNMYPDLTSRYFPDRSKGLDWRPLSGMSNEAIMGATLVDPANLLKSGYSETN